MKSENLYMTLATVTQTRGAPEGTPKYTYWDFMYMVGDRGEDDYVYKTFTIDADEVPAVVETMRELQAQNQAAIEESSEVAKGRINNE